MHRSRGEPSATLDGDWPSTFPLHEQTGGSTGEDAIEIGRRVIQAEADALLAIAVSLDTDFSDAIRMMLSCTGRIVVMGVGKSGIVGKKIAGTLASTGTPAIFVHATEAFHGDLGTIGPDDIALLVSQSGTTAETVRLIEPLRRIGVAVVAMTGDPESRLAALADCVLGTPVEREACPNNLAPTTSTTCAMALGDAIAVALMQARGFGASQFAALHPGGALGRRLGRVGDHMITGPLPLCGPSTPTLAAVKRMTDSRLGMVVVAAGKRVLGVLTDGDLRRALDARRTGEDLLQRPVEQIMSRSPIMIHPDATMAAAAHALRTNRIKTLVVSADANHIDGLLDLYSL